MKFSRGSHQILGAVVLVAAGCGHDMRVFTALPIGVPGLAVEPEYIGWSNMGGGGFSGGGVRVVRAELRVRNQGPLVVAVNERNLRISVANGEPRPPAYEGLFVRRGAEARLIAPGASDLITINFEARTWGPKDQPTVGRIDFTDVFSVNQQPIAVPPMSLSLAQPGS